MQQVKQVHATKKPTDDIEMIENMGELLDELGPDWSKAVEATEDEEEI